MKITPTAGMVSRLAARPTQIPFEPPAGHQNDPQKKLHPLSPILHNQRYNFTLRPTE